MRGVNLLHPNAQVASNRLVAECARQGITIQITDTLRTRAEQDALYAQGRTKPGSIVTWVSYPHSLHNWGVAFDYVILADTDNDGDLDADWKTPLYIKVGQIGKELGLVWGGDFENHDKPHFQLAGFTDDGLINKYGIPEKFIAVYKNIWNPAKEIEKLKERGIISSIKEPTAPVTWGELATILNKLY